MSLQKDNDSASGGGTPYVPGLGGEQTKNPPSPLARRGRRLKNLKLDRVDLVHAPANQGSKVKLFKALPSEVLMAELEKAGFDPKLIQGRIKVKDGKFHAMHEDGEQVLGSYDDRAGAFKKVAESLKKAAEPESEGGNTPSDTVGGTMKNLDVIKAKLAPEVVKHLEDLHSTNPAAAELLADTLLAKQEAPKAPDATVEKSEYAKLEKALEDERAKAAATEVRLAKMEADAAKSGFVALAKADLETLGKAEDIGSLLFEVSSNVSADVYKQLEQVLKGAAAKLADTTLFKQLTDSRDLGEGVDEVTTLAKGLVDSGKAETMEQATIKVLMQHPELYRQYRDAR